MKRTRSASPSRTSARRRAPVIVEIPVVDKSNVDDNGKVKPGGSPMSVICSDVLGPPPMSLEDMQPTNSAVVIATLFVLVVGLCVYSAATLLALLTSLFAYAGSFLEANGILEEPEKLAAITIAGFAAQLVDGSLGMGYGMTSSSVLVAAGLSPATASTSVHLAQLGTTALSGLAHHRFGNVDPRVTARISASGMAGAFLGAMLLSSLPTKAAKPIASGLLFGLGMYVFARFYRGTAHSGRVGKPGLALLAPLGFVGGFVDATGGGGWGPVATSGLLADGRLRPNRVIGVVSASEFFVTVAAVAGFGLASATAAAGRAAEGPGFRVDVVLTLLLGGLAAAPVAPRLVGTLKPQLLGVVVGGFICVTNARGLLAAAAVPAGGVGIFFAVLVIAWLSAVVQVARSGVGPEKECA